MTGRWPTRGEGLDLVEAFHHEKGVDCDDVAQVVGYLSGISSCHENM